MVQPFELMIETPAGSHHCRASLLSGLFSSLFTHLIFWGLAVPLLGVIRWLLMQLDRSRFGSLSYRRFYLWGMLLHVA